MDIRNLMEIGDLVEKHDAVLRITTTGLLLRARRGGREIAVQLTTEQVHNWRLAKVRKWVLGALATLDKPSREFVAERPAVSTPKPICPACAGTGWKEHTRPSPSVLPTEEGVMQTLEECPNCNGRGWVVG